MSTELNKLFPLAQQITVADKALSLTPFKLGELPRVFKAVEPITKLIMEAVTSEDNQFESISKVMVQGGDNVLELIAIGSRQPRSWVDGLEMDEGVQLFLAIMEVNSSFFVQKVLPLINKKIAVPVGQV